MLKLNGKLFRLTSEGTFIYDIQKKYLFKKAESPTSTWAWYLWKEFLSTEKSTYSSPIFSFYTHENTRMLSWVHRKATGWNGFSKNHNLRKKGLFSKFCFFDACFLTIHKTNPTKSDENLDFTGKLQNFVSTSIYPNKEMLQKILLSDAPQSSLSAQFLSALINAVRLNISKTFFIVTLPPSMGSSQRVMKSMSSFNTRTVPVLEHIH